MTSTINNDLVYICDLVPGNVIARSQSIPRGSIVLSVVRNDSNEFCYVTYMFDGQIKETLRWILEAVAIL